MVDARAVERGSVLAISGRATAPGAACGPLRRNRTDLSPRDVAGAILVAERAIPDDVGRILAAAGTLTVDSTLLSHVSVLCREFGKPSIALGRRGPARLLPESEGGVLRVGIGGSPADDIVLGEGDIVGLDAERGVLEVPGARTADSRAGVRTAFRAISEFAARPDDGERLAAAAAAAVASGSALAFALEAAILYRLVAGAEPLRLWLAALARAAGSPHEIESVLAGLRVRVVARAEARCGEAADAIGAASELDELDRALRRVESEVRRDATLIESMGFDGAPLEERFTEVSRAASDRRAFLRRHLAARVREALDLPDESLSPRLGGMFRLLRSARGARLAGEDVERLHRRLSHHLAEERARAGFHLVAAFDRDAPRDRQLLGGKAAMLLEAAPLLPPGCRVPRGFVVTSAAYRLHLLGETGERIQHAAEPGGDEAAVSRLARAAILGGEIPPDVVEAVRSAGEALGAPRLAVRSSATVEDTPASSRAGLFDSYLGIPPGQALMDRVRWAWASLWNPRALAALAAVGMSPLRVSMAVLVQELVPTRAAGVLLSRDPAGRPDVVLVNANWGLGESISQGDVPGDVYRIRRSTGDLLAYERGGGRLRVDVDPEGPGTRETETSDAEASRPCLSESDLSRLAAVARALEEGTGRSQDVEFGFASDDALYVFQTRRIVPGPRP